MSDPNGKIRVERLDASRVADFWKIHSAANGCDWCCCVAWWVPTWDGWGDRTAEENRRAREGLFARGEVDGYVLYADEEPAAWCQVGPRDRLAKLVKQYALAPDPTAWAVTCFVVAPTFRRRGLSKRLLAAVVSDLRARGVKRVEAFPKRGDDRDVMEMWTGPERIFAEAGFRVARDHPQAPVMALNLA